MVEKRALETTAATSLRMSRQRRTDTEIEMRLRRLLHRAGLRYRLHVRPVADLRRTADIVFPSEKVAVFVDGCFWHGCPQHGTMPKRNVEFWQTKIARNVERDEDTRSRLAAAGWAAVQVWEHDDPAEAAASIAGLVAERRAR
jgi:DNA mismatch endonuclease (patch repair protein)